MPPPYRIHLFTCTNRRPDGHPKGSCAEKGSEAVAAEFKKRVAELGLRGAVRAQQAGCLDACERGISVVVYGDEGEKGGTWYQHVTVADVEPILQEHVIGGRPVERLRMAPYEKTKIEKKA